MWSKLSCISPNRVIHYKSVLYDRYLFMAFACSLMFTSSLYETLHLRKEKQILIESSPMSIANDSFYTLQEIRSVTAQTLKTYKISFFGDSTSRRLFTSFCHVVGKQYEAIESEMVGWEGRYGPWICPYNANLSMVCGPTTQVVYAALDRIPATNWTIFVVPFVSFQDPWIKCLVREKNETTCAVRENDLKVPQSNQPFLMNSSKIDSILKTKPHTFFSTPVLAAREKPWLNYAKLNSWSVRFASTAKTNYRHVFDQTSWMVKECSKSTRDDLFGIGGSWQGIHVTTSIGQQKRMAHFLHALSKYGLVEGLATARTPAVEIVTEIVK